MHRRIIVGTTRVPSPVEPQVHGFLFSYRCKEWNDPLFSLLVQLLLLLLFLLLLPSFCMSDEANNKFALFSRGEPFHRQSSNALLYFDAKKTTDVEREWRRGDRSNEFRKKHKSKARVHKHAHTGTQTRKDIKQQPRRPRRCEKRSMECTKAGMLFMKNAAHRTGTL